MRATRHYDLYGSNAGWKWTFDTSLNLIERRKFHDVLKVREPAELSVVLYKADS